MLRLQPADFEPPGGPGVAGRQRLGRPDARAGRGEHPAPAARTTRLGRPDHQHLAAHRDQGDFTPGLQAQKVRAQKLPARQTFGGLTN